MSQCIDNATVSDTVPVAMKAHRLKRLRDCCEQWQVVGARRRGEDSRDVEAVVVAKFAEQPSAADFFLMQKVNLLTLEVKRAIEAGHILEKGGRLWLAAGCELKLHDVKPYGFASQVVALTGPKNYLMEVHTTAKAMGYKWVPESGFARFGGGPFIAPKTETELFEFLHMPWTEPEKRKWGTEFAGKPKSLELLAPDEMSAWVKSVKWVESHYAGEAHGFTLRVLAPDDEMFLKVMRTIHAMGYEGWYLRKQYRYLDLGQHFYFTQGYAHSQTQLINRKLRVGSESRHAHEWKPNPEHYRLLSVKD